MMEIKCRMDIHTHILPGMDDGASSVEESMQLLAELSNQGVKTVAVTPHFYADREAPEAFFERRQKSFSLLTGKLNSDVIVLPGAEVCYYQGISRTKELSEFTIGDTNLLLLEMPFCDWTASVINEVFSIQRDRKLQVVIAHIDRYFSRKNIEYIEEMVSFGIKLQINADAFLNRKCKWKVLNMLKMGYIHYIASDCHNMTSRPPRLTEAYAVIEKKLGKQYLEDHL